MKMTLILKLIPITFVAAGLFLGCGEAHDHHDGDGHDHHDGEGHDQDGGDKKGSAAVADDYPLKTCVVSGEELGGDHGDAFVFLHKGRTVKFCCEPCKDDFLEDPAKYIAMIDGAKNGKAPVPTHEKETSKEGESKEGESKEGEKK
jgi:hypothetical protein